MPIFAESGDDFTVTVDPFHVSINPESSRTPSPYARLKSIVMAERYVSELVNDGYKFSKLQAFQDYVRDTYQRHGDALVGDRFVGSGAQNIPRGVPIFATPRQARSPWFHDDVIAAAERHDDRVVSEASDHIHAALHAMSHEDIGRIRHATFTWNPTTGRVQEQNGDNPPPDEAPSFASLD